MNLIGALQIAEINFKIRESLSKTESQKAHLPANKNNAIITTLSVYLFTYCVMEIWIGYAIYEFGTVIFFGLRSIKMVLSFVENSYSLFVRQRFFTLHAPDCRNAFF